MEESTLVKFWSVVFAFFAETQLDVASCAEVTRAVYDIAHDTRLRHALHTQIALLTFQNKNACCTRDRMLHLN